MHYWRGILDNLEALRMIRFNRFTVRYERLWVLLLAIVCLTPLGCLESKFNLASESRLPKWITLPAGVTRADVSLTISYYTTLSGGNAQFTLLDKSNRAIEKTSGKDRCGKPFQLTTPSHGSSPDGYPNYTAVTVGGITEILQQRKPEDILYVTDDPDVWKQYRAVGCD
jgi:hypothetical protein